MDRCVTGGDADAVPVCCGKDKVGCESKGLSLPADLHSCSHLWPRVLGNY